MGDFHIAIIGGGVGGLALANYLQRWAPPTLRVTLFERRLSWDDAAGGTLLVQGEGLDVLQELGLYDRLHAATHGAQAEDLPPVLAELQSQLMDMGFDAEAAGRALIAAQGDLEQAINALTSDSAPPSAVSSLHVLRETLIQLLLEGLGASVDLQINSEVLAVRETDAGVQVDFRPTLRLEGDRWVKNHDSARFETAAFTMVVGADGNAPSSQGLRCIIGNASQAESLPLLVLQALSLALPGTSPAGHPPCRSEPLVQKRVRGDVVVGRLDVGFAVGRAPASEAADCGLVLWEYCTVLVQYSDAMARFPQPPAWAETMMACISTNTGGDAAVRAKASMVVDQAASSVDGARMHAWVPFRKESVERWSSDGGRVVVLGDAAHLVPPTAGWGANLAMGDARCLASALAALAALDEWLPELVREQLARYEALRREAVAAGVLASMEEARRFISRRR